MVEKAAGRAGVEGTYRLAVRLARRFSQDTTPPAWAPATCRVERRRRRDAVERETARRAEGVSRTKGVRDTDGPAAKTTPPSR